MNQSGRKMEGAGILWGGLHEQEGDHEQEQDQDDDDDDEGIRAAEGRPKQCTDPRKLPQHELRMLGGISMLTSRIQKRTTMTERSNALP
jgi:hypothetical protein